MEPHLPFERGTPGQSAKRELGRRRANRERRSRERHPLIGGALFKLQDVPQSERSYATGSAGEEQVASSLTRWSPDAILLHDRRMPRSRANIDHIAMAASGVWVIDAKRYRGRVEVVRPLFGDARLKIAGRDQTKLVEGLDRQVAAVRTALESFYPTAAIHGCFCFVQPEGLLADSRIPLIRTLRINGYQLLYPRRLAKRLRADGDLTPGDQESIAAHVAQEFPQA